MEFQRNERPASNTGRSGGPPSKRKRSNSKQCFAFKKGNCEKGSECKFKHGASEQQQQQQPGAQQQQQQQPRAQKQQQQQPRAQQQQQAPRLVTSSARPDEKEGAPHPEPMEVEAGGGGGGGGGGGKAYMTESLFSALPISPLVKRALAEVLKYPNMTQVGGTDVLFMTENAQNIRPVIFFFSSQLCRLVLMLLLQPNTTQHNP
jgi:hypothetical protein